MNKVVLNEVEFRANVERAVEISRSLMSEDNNYLDNVLNLCCIGNRIVGELWETEFHIFGVIASDTDHLPTMKTRQLCSEEMLRKSDKELKNIIGHYKEEATKACNEILSKYESV